MQAGQDSINNTVVSKNPAGNAMNPAELRASIGLASVYGLRMLGLFIILPIFALYAEHLPGGESHLLIGVALGAYGLTQAVLQIPAGWLSDHYGRKPVIYIGLVLFAIGSLIAASADNIYWIIAGRIIQGAGAINAAVMALTADLTREDHRTKAMAMIGMTIGFSFALSMVLSPLLYARIGMSGIFIMTAVLAVLAMLVVAFFIPNPAITRFHTDTEANGKRLGEVLRNKNLLRLDFGIFSLHAILMSVFMQVPFLLKNNGLHETYHWKVYLPVMLLAFVFMIPPMIFADKKSRTKEVFVGAIALAALSQLILLIFNASLISVAASLLLFFIAFNLLEAMLPSLISKTAPLVAKGTAMGVYSSVQFLGAFVGAAAGGFMMEHFGGNAALIFAIVLLLLWLIVAVGMQSPAAVRTRLYSLPQIDEVAARLLQSRLMQLKGVKEAMVVAAEQMVSIKVETSGFDEASVEQLLKGV
jgi:MFS family permease